MAGSTHDMGISPAFFVSAVERFLVSAGFLSLVASSFLVPDVAAQRRMTPGPLDTLGDEVSQADGLKILDAFRRLGVSGDFRLNFQLRIKPVGVKTRTVPGLLLGTQTQFGPLTRIDLALKAADVSDRGELVPAEVKRLLLQNGIFANVLEANSWGEKPVESSVVESGAYFEGIAGSDFTVFDLLMPFSFWQNFDYEGRTKSRGRPTHVFSLFPPKGDEQLKEHVSKVRIFLDEEFNALNRVEIFDPNGVMVKTIVVDAFKIVDGQGVLSGVSVRNEKTRDKTEFKVLEAAIGVEVPGWVFQPEGLDRNIYGTPLAVLQAVKAEKAE